MLKKKKMKQGTRQHKMTLKSVNILGAALQQHSTVISYNKSP